MVKHDVLVRGFGFGPTLHDRPVLLGMKDTDFPERFFGDFGRADNARVSTAAPVGTSSQGRLHLLQPVQRTVQVAVVDLACDVVGEPRLSPMRVESAGLVIRRVPIDASTRAHRHDRTLEGWMQTAEGKFGWVPMRRGDQDLDPDPAKRPALYSGQEALDRLLSESTLKTSLTETFSPAFVMPPDVCGRLSRTLLFAVIPTASSDVSDGSPVALDYSSDDTLSKQLSPLLAAVVTAPPQPGKAITPDMMSKDYWVSKDKNFPNFIDLLQVIAIEFSAFNGTDAGNALVAALNRGTVTFGNKTTTGIGDFLSGANTTLLDSDPSHEGSVVMPAKWSAFPSDDLAAVLTAAADCARAQGAKVLVPEGRYQDHTRLYRLRLFMRVRGHDDCPLETVWSDYSDPFEIAPWYESAGLVGPPVPMPKPSPDFLKAAKPNVSFVVPKELMSASQASLASLLLGIKPADLELPTFVCGFSIPIITVCAFIVLHIFLTILNIVFRWLPFVKTCVPIPQATVPKVGGQA